MAFSTGSPFTGAPRRVLNSAFFGENVLPTHMFRSSSKESALLSKGPPTTIVVCKYSAFKGSKQQL